MKNCNFKYLATIAFSMYSMLTFSQNWRVGGNTTAQLGGNPPDIGTTQNNPLNVKTVQAQPINFLTANTQRMVISGTTGFVGINTLNPTRMFDVNGKVKVQDLTSNGTNAGIVTYFNDGTLQSLPFTGNANQALLANGTFADVAVDATNGTVLNTSNKVELGGFLTHNTTISKAAFNLRFLQSAAASKTGTPLASRIGISIGPLSDPIDAPLCIFGPIHSTEMSTNSGSMRATILYSNTSQTGNPGVNSTQDGFRIVHDRQFKGPENDVLVIEKTDGNQPNPDGCIVFTNTGNDGDEELSMTISGNGFVGIGQNFSGTATPGTEPKRRLEVLENDDDPLNEPQVRLTHTQAIPPPMTLGVFATGFSTDLQTTQNGDFAIMPAVDSTAIGVFSPFIQYRRQKNVGINTITPGNTMEINSAFATTSSPNSQPTDPTIGIAPTGWAGLRFTDLNSTSVAQLNPSNKILSVNANGDVILVSDKIGTGGGGTFVGSQNGLNNTVTALNPSGAVELGGLLLHDTKVATGASNIEINYESGGNISLGSNPNVLSASGNQANIAIGLNNLFDAASTGNIFTGTQNHAISPVNEAKILGNHNSISGPNNTIIGNNNNLNLANTTYSESIILGKANTVNAYLSGVFGIGNTIQSNSNSDFILGDRNYIRNTVNNSIAIGTNVVVDDTYRMSLGVSNNDNAKTNLLNYILTNGAATAHLDPTIVADNIIPAINISMQNNIGVKRYSPQFAIDVAGTIRVATPISVSDSILKTNIHPLSFNATQKLKQFRTVTFEWITKTDTGMYGTQYGFTAQQIQTVMPDLVKTDSFGIKSLNVTGMIPLLVKSIQEQQSTIDSMRTMMSQMATMLNSCCQNTSTRTQSNPTNTVIDVELSDKDIIVLNQNVPNPFAEQTTIVYNVPEKSGFAQIIFNDMKGQIIKVVDVKAKGKGQLNVFANDLSTGMYTYSLYVDGKLIDTKKMVKTE